LQWTDEQIQRLAGGFEAGGKGTIAAVCNLSADEMAEFWQRSGALPGLIKWKTYCRTIKSTIPPAAAQGWQC
jgi:hypothetical protein